MCSSNKYNGCLCTCIGKLEILLLTFLINLSEICKDLPEICKDLSEICKDLPEIFWIELKPD